MALLDFRPLRLGVVVRAAFWMLLAIAPSATRASTDTRLKVFIDKQCLDCHDSDSKKGGLDLSTLKFDPNSPKGFAEWVIIHDRTASGEMPPAKKKVRPEPRDLAAFTNTLASALVAMEQAKTAKEGRATQRRLNRYEYEATLQDLLSLPYLEVKGFLPEDTTSSGFNKVGDALDVSHVQMARYMSAADFALRKAIAPRATRPETQTKRYYAWDQGEFFGSIKLEGPLVRRTFPLVGFDLQRDLMAMDHPKRIKEPDQATRDREGMGVVVSTYEPTEIRFGKFRAPVSGRYRLRFSGYSFWIDPKYTNVTQGRRDEPVTIYSDTSPRILRKLGSFDVGNTPTEREMEVYLIQGETIRPDAARLHRSRPPDHQNPFNTPQGMPGVAFQWMEVEGPLVDQWPPAGHQVLFGDLPLSEHSATNSSGRRRTSTVVEVTSTNAELDAPRLLRHFMERAYRVPVTDQDVNRFLVVIQGALKAGFNFTDSMIAGYTAVLSSPGFLYFHEEQPGRLDDRALAERLSYFLLNSAPDAELRQLADARKLHKPDVLHAQTERLLKDPKSRRLVDAFLDYWLDLRVIAASAPDEQLYPDYQLDDLLVESISEETQLFFTELLNRNLGITNLVNSDFAMLNERLATHYGIGGVKGVAVHRVSLPGGSVRGGLLTQASVLKVTANGTSTSPVKRGAWIMSRIIGRPPPPPPASVPAVDPDIRGATTIRDQLAKHRTQETCNACHRNIDPAGFALESFDVMGAWRDRYRSVGKGDPVKGIGHNGVYYHFGLGPDVDSSGELPDGQKFDGIRQLKQCLARDDTQLARNLARQLIIYSTGAPIRFSDREAVEKILTKNRAEGYAVRSLVHDIVQSGLFLNK